MPIRSIAELKRTMKIGQMWHCLHHGSSLWPPKDMGIRPLARLQTNSFAFKNPLSGESSWCDFPKLKDIKFHTEGTGFDILEDDLLRLTYTLVSEDTHDEGTMGTDI